MAIDNAHAGAILLEIFENGLKSDLITLVAGVGGQRIPIHRVVLAANSKYFTAMLGPNFKEAGENEFTFDETDGSMVKAIVDFCYTGRIDLTEENVSTYLAIASSVELNMLEQKCFGFFADKLNMSNAVKTLAIAEKYSGHALRQKASDLVCELFDELPLSHIDELDHRFWKEVLMSDAVHAEEQLIFDRLLSWCRKDEGVRRQHMAELLKLVRLPLIPLQYINGNTLQMIYKEFNSLEYLQAEYNRRIGCPIPIAGVRRRCSIYCSFMQEEGVAGAEQSAVKLQRYNSALNAFEDAGDIGLGIRTNSGIIFLERKVYILGGLMNGVVLRSVSVFDLNSGEEKVLPDMSSARVMLTAILVGKFIYVFGGYNDVLELMTSCERFNLETETWETMKPMNIARISPAVTVLHEYIYVAGGHNHARHLKDVELFDPRNDEWITLSPMNDARSCFAFLASNDYLYAMGYSSSIEKYDPWKNRWMEIDASKFSKNFTSSLTVNGNIYAITSDGELCEIKIDENRGCSFLPLAKSIYDGDFLWQHSVFRS